MACARTKMKVPAVSFLASLLLERSSHPSAAHISPKIAVTRTFSANDATELPASFDIWDEFPPCAGNTSYDADLVLAFSQSMDASTLALKVMKSVAMKFAKTRGFGSCFKKVIGFGCNIDPSKDRYDSQEADSPMWVNGPNRQFERTFRTMQHLEYDYFYLMEMDSVPCKSFWLDSLVDEVESRLQDFAVLGR